MSFLKKIGSNIKKNVTPKELKETGGSWLWGVLGGIIYLTTASVIKKVTKWDTSGWTGLLLGVGTSTLVGFASDKKGIVIGGLMGGSFHLLYNYANEPFANMTGEQFFPFDRSVVEKTNSPAGAIPPEIDVSGLNETLNDEFLPPTLQKNPDGTISTRRITLPDRSQVITPMEEPAMVGDKTDSLDINEVLGKKVNLQLNDDVGDRNNVLPMRSNSFKSQNYSNGFNNASNW